MSGNQRNERFIEADAQPCSRFGRKLRTLREAKGVSRRELAKRLKVDVSSLAGWEAGKRFPRDGVRRDLARVLGIDMMALFEFEPMQSASVSAVTVDTVRELHRLLLDLTPHTKTIRALRLAAPYTTTAYVQTEWRQLLSERILDGSLEIQRIEVFYDLRRLKEMLSNILRYEGKRYYVKAYCAAEGEVMPAMGGYFFDNEEYLIGAYWTGVPPHNKPGLRLSGLPIRTYFDAYWDEIWSRGTFINTGGSHELSAVKELVLKLGLEPSNWEEFVSEARALEVGDGAPPLI